MRLRFAKMQGQGNDFVVLDGVRQAVALGPREVRAIADRHTGVGCDQLILLERADGGLADVSMRIFNADGGEVEACGNASRCVAALLLGELGRDHMVIETKAGLLDAEADKAGIVRVDMGRVRLDWRDIPLAEPQDTLHLELAAGPLCARRSAASVKCPSASASWPR